MSKSGEWAYTALLLLFTVIMFAYLFSVNPSTEAVWNNGVCAQCDQRFVVVKAKGSFNWYVCQECGQEVKRSTWWQ